MKKARLKHLGLLPVLAGFALAGALYQRFPESAPVHWDWQGEIDAYAQRPVGAFLMPAIVMLTYVLLLALPKISPREFADGVFNAVYERILLALTSFMFCISCLVTLVGAGMPAALARYPLAALGLMLALGGHFLSRKNAVRPDEPANAAARGGILAGRLLLVSGLIVLAGAAFGSSVYPAMVAVPTALIISLAHSFVLCWREQNARDQAGKGPF